MDLLEANDLFNEKLENDVLESRYDIANAKSFYLVSTFWNAHIFL